jgi:PAS domain S-box-containing protein
MSSPFLSPELLLSAIVDSSDDALVSKNLSSVVMSWNNGAVRLFGFSPEEMIGQPITRLFPGDRSDEENHIMERIVRGKRVDHFETIRLHKNGTPIQVSLTISPVRDERGNVIGASKIARDVTRQNAAFRKLEVANEELRRADRLKSEFLATLT